MALRSLWMLAACFFFMLMALFAKICTGHFSAWEVVFYRSLVGLVFMTAVMVRKKVAFATFRRSVVPLAAPLCAPPYPEGGRR